LKKDKELSTKVVAIFLSKLLLKKGLPDDNSELAPPDPIPNSVVKRLSADGSLGFPHVRVGHRQAFLFTQLFPAIF
tara:strand:+ start:136 stop:363 length:228 start_codon:yes stop_codon:yes gene_type:complete